MPTSRSDAGRLVAVRLSDVPLKVRRRFGLRLYEIAVEQRDLVEALDIERAVEHPSDRLHWLPEKAVRKVLR